MHVIKRFNFSKQTTNIHLIIDTFNDRTFNVMNIRCNKNISQYFTKAYYRYKDNSICYDCYDNLKKELTLSR